MGRRRCITLDIAHEFRCAAIVVAPQVPSKLKAKSSTCSTTVVRRIISAPAAEGAPPPMPRAAVQRVNVDEGSAGQRLDNFLLRLLKGVPKTHVYRVIRSGEVRVNRGRASADTRLAPGDEVRLPPLRVAERAR